MAEITSNHSTTSRVPTQKVFVPSEGLLRAEAGLAKAGVSPTGFEVGKLLGHSRPLLGIFLVAIAFVAELVIVFRTNMSTGVGFLVILALIAVDFVVSWLKEGGLGNLRLLYAAQATKGGIPDQFEAERLATARKGVVLRRALFSIVLIAFALIKLGFIGYEVTIQGREFKYLLGEDFYVPAIIFLLTLLLHLFVTGGVLRYLIYKNLFKSEHKAFLRSDGSANVRTIEDVVFDSPEPLTVCEFGEPDTPHRLHLIKDAEPGGLHRYAISSNGVVRDSHFPSALNHQTTNTAKDTLKRALLRSQLAAL